MLKDRPAKNLLPRQTLAPQELVPGIHFAQNAFRVFEGLKTPLKLLRIGVPPVDGAKETWFE
jgi:hypothetical protein